MFNFELLEELKLDDYDPSIGTVVGYNKCMPIGNQQLQFEFRCLGDEVSETIAPKIEGYYHGIPIYDIDAPELRGGYQDN